MSFQIKDLFSILFKTLVDILVLAVISAVILALLPFNIFSDFPIDPKSRDVKFADKLDNWNNHLVDRAQHLLNGVIVGPESLAEKNAFLYTGLADGRLVEINKETLKTRDVANFGSIISKDNKGSDFGRILGVRFHTDGYLYVLDVVNGLFRINVTTDHKEIIDFKNDKITKYYDDLVFDPKLNVIYISVITTKWPLNRILFGLLDSDYTGYIFAYNFDTKSSIILYKGFQFSNGLQISSDKKSLLVAESNGYRILKISLQSIHKSIKENKLLKDNDIQVFAELPGEPDNIRLDPNGDVLVGMYSVRTNGKLLSDHLSNWPIIRRAIGRIVYALYVAIDFINSKTIASKGLEAIANDLYTGNVFKDYLPTTGAVIKLDAKSGQIKQIYGSNNFNCITEAIISNEGDLYFGSAINHFLGKILKKDL
ncbi:adipocyte plasma membrane-associated protein-like [Oppia nitens]|uniref:adipocyte plasma membrane-associated protein-like n=1 Tax=Oppia nitens TaxID=1686743 RepID=UPI0023DA88ED|nr:adipocyte plasma membrane-associated protein-like [Oppia nitens]